MKELYYKRVCYNKDLGKLKLKLTQPFGQQRNLGQQIQQQQTADVNQLGLLGGLQQAQTQAGLTATQEGNRLRAMEPYERMGQYGSGVMGLISGMGNQYQSQVTPNQSPLQTALGTASVLGGIFNPVVIKLIMRRTLNRPMFRRGGEVSTPKRGLVDGPGSYAGLQDVIPTAQDIEDYRANQPEAAPDRSTSDFLINFGLDLISRSPTGNIFQTAATSAKEPFKAMQAARYAQEGTERDEYNDMYKAIMTAKSDMLSSEGVQCFS